jgi:hypothetical protein
MQSTFLTFAALIARSAPLVQRSSTMRFGTPQKTMGAPPASRRGCLSLSSFNESRDPSIEPTRTSV